MSAPTWQLRKEGLLGELEKKLEAIQDLCALIDSYGPDTPCDKITGDFCGYLLFKIERQFREAKRIKILEKKSRKIDVIIAEFPMGARELQKQNARQKRVKEELDVLRKSDNGQFLEHLRGVVLDLLHKNTRVSTYRNVPDALKQAIAASKLAIAPEHIQKTEFTSFGVAFILEPAYYRKIDTHKEETVGQHFTGTPFSLVSGAENTRSEEDVRGTLRHEQKHNLLDGVSNIHKSSMPLAEVKKSVAARNVKRLEAKKLLDNLHEEIIAASEQAEKAWKSGSDDDFYALRTAGREASKMLAFLTEERLKVGNKDNKEWKSALMRIENDIRDKFRRIAGHMKASLAVAREIGEKATQDVHVLFVLLRPSQYRHILSYLEYKYGKEKVREHLAKIQVTH